ncbi:MAG: glycoside hydrolase family 5 protein [Pedobacter sp.]|nr:glycoside hydrolase family 5 protein [Pedobacter sp.]
MNRLFYYVIRFTYLTLLLFGTAFLGLSQTSSSVIRHGALKVSGGKMVDRNGEPPQLRGISLSWSIWGGSKYYNPEVLRWLKTDFNINLLRVSMAVEPAGGYLKDPEGQEKLIIPVIDEAIRQGIYVLIDWHDHHANVNVDRAKAFFSKISKKYAGVPNVIYEIWNEPERVEWKVVKDYADVVVAEIRKNDPENIIVVGSPHWDQDIDLVAKEPLTGFQNIVYSFHFYASEPNHQEALMRRADEALSLGLPIFVTEWGVGEATGDGVFDVQKTDTWFMWMEKHKLSSANWNLTDKKETTALLLPGASANGSWPLNMLSPAGIYIRTQLKKFNK